MNYEKIYNQIIEKAKNENRTRDNGEYYEKHHIKPRSLYKDLIKDENNIVLLTAREHFICHKLLEKIYDCPQMKYAIWRMCNDGKYKVSARYYEYVKNKIQIESSKLNKGRKIGPEVIKRISEKRKGYKHTDETIEKMKKSYDPSKHVFSDEVKEKLSQLASLRFKGCKKSEAFRKHLSEIRTGENNPMYGRNVKDLMSDEDYLLFKKKLSESLTGHVVSEETKKKIGEKTKLRTQGEMNPNARKVKILEINKEFGTISDCAKFIGVNRNMIARKRNGNVSVINNYTIIFV